MADNGHLERHLALSTALSKACSREFEKHPLEKPILPQNSIGPRTFCVVEESQHASSGPVCEGF